MDLIYTWWRIISIQCDKTKYIFSPENNFSVKVDNYKHIYELIRHWRHWEHIRFASDPATKTMKLKELKPWIVSLWQSWGVKDKYTVTVQWGWVKMEQDIEDLLKDVVDLWEPEERTEDIKKHLNNFKKKQRK